MQTEFTTPFRFICSRPILSLSSHLRLGLPRVLLFCPLREDNPRKLVNFIHYRVRIWTLNNSLSLSSTFCSPSLSISNVRRSVWTFRLYFYSRTNQMHNISNLFYFGTTLHVSDGLSVHHQESKTVHTASGICHTGSVAAC